MSHRHSTNLIRNLANDPRCIEIERDTAAGRLTFALTDFYHAPILLDLVCAEEDVCYLQATQDGHIFDSRIYHPVNLDVAAIYQFHALSRAFFAFAA